MLKIDVLSLFPEVFSPYLQSSILGRAIARGLLDISVTNFRDFATDRHHTVDDYPFGGGAGMVLKPEPLFLAVEAVIAKRTEDASQTTDSARCEPRVVLLCPQGRVFTQAMAEEFSREEHLILISGHYEGFDERIREHLVTDVVSIGDYVLTGGELPALVVIDAVSRLQSGVLGNDESAHHDSFSDGLLEFPQYTRPYDFRGWVVPEVLMSGHHARIAQWRREQSLRRTLELRPDLLRDGTVRCSDLTTTSGLQGEDSSSRP